MLHFSMFFLHFYCKKAIFLTKRRIFTYHYVILTQEKALTLSQSQGL